MLGILDRMVELKAELRNSPEAQHLSDMLLHRARSALQSKLHLFPVGASIPEQIVDHGIAQIG